MTTAWESLLIAWSIRISMLLFVSALICRALDWHQQGLSALAKGLWAAGFAFFVVHVVSAFQFVHHWSHSDAYRATAEQTREQLGFAYGVGVYFNYVFLLVWAVDICLMWMPETHLSKRLQFLSWMGLGYLLFIAFNGTVVFETGWTRVLGCVATVLLVGLAVRKAVWLKRETKLDGGVTSAMEKQAVFETQRHGEAQS